jgi:glycosyltransferase involved in cell wall biosynthesis
MAHIVFSNYDDLGNPYYAGGGAEAVHQVARHLARHHRVTVITGKYPGCHDQIVDGVHYRRVGFAFLGPKIGQLAYQICLPFLIATSDFDIWFESFTPPFSTNCLQLFTSKPVIGVAHMLSGQDMRRKYRLPFHLLEKLGLRTYRHLVATSLTMKTRLAQLQPRAQITVIPNGIPRLPRISQQDQPTHLLYLGRIEVNQKGLDLLLRAYTQIQPCPYPLYIAGTGPPSQLRRLRALISNLQLTDQVRLLGRVAGAQKARLFRRAALVIVPSRFESFSLVSLEALSYARPLLTFNLPSLNWIPENCAFKVTPFDVPQLAQAINRLTSHPQKSRRLGNHGRTLASRFTWNAIARQYQQLISAVMQSGIVLSQSNLILPLYHKQRG